MLKEGGPDGESTHPASQPWSYLKFDRQAPDESF